MVAWLIRDERAVGPFNVTAPAPVTNREFTRALGRALHRPAVIPVPAFALRLVLGELSSALLTGQRVLPAHAEQLGFRFVYADLDAALASVLA
jgi:NAD dependent epimerase/dehydratase family enzyme